MIKSSGQSKQNQLVSRYFDLSKKWNEDLYSEEIHFFNRLLTRRKERTFKLLDKIMPGIKGRAIDIGCGPGAYIEEFMKRGFDIYGIDISQGMLNTCRARLNINEQTFRSNFKCADLDHIPFDDCMFKAAACIGVFGLLMSDDRAISEIYRVLEPGGIFLLAVENMMSLSNIDFMLRNKIKTAITRKSGENKFLQSKKTTYRGLTIPSDWFQDELGLNYKIYNPYKLVAVMKDNGFSLAGSLTVGHEFRLLRRFNFFSKAVDAAEIGLEEFFVNHRIPYFSNSGQFFISAFRKNKNA